MSKKTLALIIFLFLITCTLLYFALKTPTYQNQQVAGPTPTPLSVNAHTQLTLQPASATESSQVAQHTLAVVMATGNNKVNSIQIELAYDPQALTNVAIKPGSFFTQPTALINNVNTTDGRISYALAEQMTLSGKSGQGTVALVTFNVSPTFTGKSTTISFLPKTAVAADRVLESVLKKTTDYTLDVAAAMAPASNSAK